MVCGHCDLEAYLHVFGFCVEMRGEREMKKKRDLQPSERRQTLCPATAAFCRVTDCTKQTGNGRLSTAAPSLLAEQLLPARDCGPLPATQKPRRQHAASHYHGFDDAFADQMTPLLARVTQQPQETRDSLYFLNPPSIDLLPLLLLAETFV